MDTIENQGRDTADEPRDHALDEAATTVDETAPDEPDGAATSVHGMDIRELEQRIHGGTLTDEQRAELAAITSAATKSITEQVAKQLQPTMTQVRADFAKQVAPIFAGVKERLKPLADDFNDFEEAFAALTTDPAAHERYRQWVRTSPLTGGTMKGSAGILNCSDKSARKYYKDPSAMKEKNAWALRWAIGLKAFYEMAFGPNSYDQAVKEREKAEYIERATKLLESAEPDIVKFLVAAMVSTAAELDPATWPRSADE